MSSEKVHSKQFWKGIKYDIPLCCIMFYESAWHGTIKKEISQYLEKTHILTNNQGIVLCPECLTKKVSNLILYSELAS